MGFISKNWKPLLLTAFVIISEVVITMFKKQHSVIDKTPYIWGEMLYYFFAQVGYVSFLPALFLYWNEKNIDSKGIYLGLVVWNVLEVFQEINSLLKLNISFLSKTGSYVSDGMQVLFIIFVIIFTYKAYLKCHT